jgi:ribonuclease P protein subunit RPR2
MDTETKRIAKQRIHTLFKLANTTMPQNPKLAQRYADTARRIAMASKTRLPNQYRRQICKHCKSFILPGINCRTRIQQKREPHIVTTCLECGGRMRIPTKRKQEKPQA